MKNMILILSLAVAILFGSGCATLKVGKTSDFRKTAKKVSFDSDHSYKEIASILNKYVPKCLYYRINGTILSPSIKGDNKSATLFVQYDDTYDEDQNIEDTDGEKGYYALIMDIKKAGKKSIKVDMYKGPRQFQPLYNGVKQWMEGRKGCPDLMGH